MVAQALLKLLPPEVEVMRLIKLKCSAEVTKSYVLLV